MCDRLKSPTDSLAATWRTAAGVSTTQSNELLTAPAAGGATVVAAKPPAHRLSASHAPGGLLGTVFILTPPSRQEPRYGVFFPRVPSDPSGCSCPGS